MRNRLHALGIALAVAGVVLGWQILTVRFTYGGNWSGLFCTGANMPFPPALAHENIYVFPNSAGYDGQAYHYIAHDPWFERGLASYIDAPRLRSRRILVPAMAWAVAFGNNARIDAALIAVVLAFVALGAYWSARLAQHFGKPTWTGALFVLAPAVLVSIDRILTDGALAAFCIGFVLYFRRGHVGHERWVHLWLVCALAALTRETGVGLIAAACIFLLTKRDLRRAVFFAASALPLAIWIRFTALHTPPEKMDWMGPIPFEGILYRLTHPSHYDLAPAVAFGAIVLDHVAVLGIALAIFAAIRKAWARECSMTAIAIYIFALLAIFLRNQDAWGDAYAFGRTLSPLLVLLAVDALEAPNSRSAARALLPAAMQVPRIGFQWGKQILNVAKGILG